MPIYEYKCNKCGDTFEVIQKFSDEPLEVHGNGCDGAVERLLTAPALQFKGSGWYITDYARGNGSSKSPGSDANGAKKETKSESKSAETATPAAPTDKK